MRLDLSSCDPAWLAAAEASLTQGKPGYLGLSFFFLSDAEARRFVKAVPASRPLTEPEGEVRASFHVVPRRWYKLAVQDGRIDGLSQYWQIDPAVTYPITTIRLFLRKYGAEPPPELEKRLEPYLRRRRQPWILGLKHRARTTTPRVSLRVDQDQLPDALTRMAALRYLPAELQGAYYQACQGAGNTEPFYITFGPGQSDDFSIDFSNIPASAIPLIDPCVATDAAWRYAKVRIAPETDGPRITWTGYLGYQEYRTYRSHFRVAAALLKLANDTQPVD